MRVMKISPLLFALAGAFALGSAAVADAPGLRTTRSGFQPGKWQVSGVGFGEDAGRAVCVRNAGAFLLGGKPANQCMFNVIADEDTSSVVTYKCASGMSGRTALRMDAAGLFTMDVQGIEGGLPYGGRSEWKRVGSC